MKEHNMNEEKDKDDDNASYSTPISTTSSLCDTCRSSTKTTSLPSTSQVSKLNNFLVKFTTFGSNSYTMDYGLKFIQYFLWSLSRLTKKHNKNNLVLRFVHLMLSISQGGSFRRNSSKIQYTDISPELKTIYNKIFMARYFMRLYGFPMALEAILNRSWSSGWKDERIHKFGDIMAWSMLFYYPLEHFALMKWSAPKIFPNINATRYSALSCRFWLIYVLTDLVSSFYKIKELKHKQKKEKIDTQEHEESILLQKNIKHQYMQMVRNIFYVLPCYTWSSYEWDTNPPFSEDVVNGCMVAETIVCMYQQICAMMS